MSGVVDRPRSSLSTGADNYADNLPRAKAQPLGFVALLDELRASPHGATREVLSMVLAARTRAFSDADLDGLLEALLTKRLITGDDGVYRLVPPPSVRS